MKCNIRSAWLALGLIAGALLAAGCVEDSDCYLTRTCPGPDASVEAATDEDDEDAVSDDEQSVPLEPAPSGSTPAGTANDGPDITLPLVPLPAATATQDAGGQDAIDAAMPTATTPAEPVGTAVVDAAVVDTATHEDAGDSGGTQPEPDEPIDYCAENNGGCDPLAECNNGLVGAECGGCPTGYLGNGAAGCAPGLVGLGLSHGALSPAFDPATNSYAITVPVFIQNLTLTPAAPSEATIGVDGAVVGLGTTWTSPELNLGLNTISLQVEQPGQPRSTYTLNVTRGAAATAYLKASNTGEEDRFSTSVALSSDGTTLAVGAPEEGSSASGIGGSENNDDARNSGAVYVFTRSGNAWVQQAYVKASNTHEYARFGGAVALSSDGNTLAVGAASETSTSSGVGGVQNNAGMGSGAVYVFTRSGAAWAQEAFIKAWNPGEGDGFGSGVELSNDGNTLAVAAPSEGSSAIGVGGSPNDNDAPYSGAVYVFTRSGSSWAQQAYVKASNTGADDAFGPIALSGDGNTLAVGATGEDSNATGVGGAQDNNQMAYAGAVYLFTRDGYSWAQQAYLKASNTAAGDHFGGALALSSNGDTLAVGAYGEDSSATGVGGDEGNNDILWSGAVYVFARSGSAWAQQAYVKASEAHDYGFGHQLALSSAGDTLAVGATGDDSSATGVGATSTDGGAPGSGAVFVFTRRDSGWTQESYVKASNTGAGDLFGSSLALSADGSTLAVGAYLETSSATGTSGAGQSDNSAPSAGAVYVYR